MSRKIIFIITGAILFLILLALLWLWLLNRAPAADPGSPSGFGTSTDRTVGGQGGRSGANIPGSVGGQTQNYTVAEIAGGYLISAGGNAATLPPGNYRISKGGTVIGNYTVRPSGAGSYNLSPFGISGGALPPGAYDFTPIPLGGGIGTGGIGVGTSTPIQTQPIDTGGGTSTATTTPGGEESGAWIANWSERPFNATEINDINGTTGLGGTPLIATTPQPAGVQTSGIVIAATAAACLAQWLANQAAGVLANFTDPISLINKATDVPVQDATAVKQRTAQNVLQCIVKSIAQAAIDQITRSVVGWINSGFNGKPSFVTNFNQYFANVADQAAGEFIRSSALSFLCSPYSAKIKIAIAQSYANRFGNGTGSCTLSKVTNNINGFLRGNWGAGGWNSMLQLTTAPINNLYGSYGYAQVGFQTSIASAQREADRQISPGGFISVQKCDNTATVTAGAGNPRPSKNCKITTPGQVIQDSLNQSLGSSIGQLQVAQNIDEIIRALINQLMLKTLYGGLANANNGITNPLAPAVDQAATEQAKALLEQLRAALTYAGQYGSVQQGSIADIQNAQGNLNNAYNCWSTVATSTPNTAQGTQKAAEADQAITALEARIGPYNNEIERVNASLANIQNLQSQVLFATTPQDVAAAGAAISAASASGGFITAAEVTTAQQNRATLQAELATRNQTTAASLTECRAILRI